MCPRAIEVVNLHYRIYVVRMQFIPPPRPTTAISFFPLADEPHRSLRPLAYIYSTQLSGCGATATKSL